MELDDMLTNFIFTAQELTSSGNYAAAFRTFLTTFVVAPEIRPQAFSIFHDTLQKYNDELFNQEKVPEMFNNFKASLNHYPDHPYLLNDLGSYLYKLRFMEEACVHFAKAVNGDMTYVAAEKNLNSVKNLLVERWHFRMLNDKTRNNSYKKALEEKIQSGESTVLDIGSGTGLLSVVSHQNKPKQITAIESSKTMFEISKLVLTENKVSNITVINKKSLNCNRKLIPDEHNVLVTEIFDAGLFGEGALQTLSHAVLHLLTKDAVVIPMKAELFVAGLHSDYLTAKYRLGTDIKKFLNISNSQVQILSDEPYDSEDLHFIKDVKYVTEPASIMMIHFNNIQHLFRFLISTNQFEVCLKPTFEGKADIFAVWFDLHLTENIKITTNPLDPERSNAWQQAIFYDFIPMELTMNEDIKIKFSTQNEKLALVAPADSDVQHVSSEIIRFLNDSDLMNLYSKSIGAVYIYLCQISEVQSLQIVDLCPFPILGFLMMLRGSENLTCYAKNEEDKQFIIKVFEANNLPVCGINFVMEEELTTSYFENKKYHLVSHNINNLNGDIDFKLKEIRRHLSFLCLHQGGLVLPYQITLFATVARSDWIESSNRLFNENVCNIKIAEFLNKFQVSQHYHIDINTTPHEKLSEPIPLSICTKYMVSQIIPFECSKSGEANAIICSYQIQLIENGDTVNTNREKCFVDTTVFMVNPRVKVTEGKEESLYFSVDMEAGFKLFLVSDD